MALKLLFLSGTHRTPSPKKLWTDEDVEAVFSASTKPGLSDFLFVEDHTPEDLPVVGRVSRGALSLGEYKGKKAIFFDDSEAVFSQGAVNGLRQRKKDKMSVKIKSGMVMSNAAFVTRAAVEEMNVAAFAEGQTPECEYAIFEAEDIGLFGTNEYRVPRIGRMLSGLRDFFIEKFGLETADKVLPSSDVNSLMDYPSEDPADTGSVAAQFSQNQTDSQMTEAEKKELDQLKAEKEALKVENKKYKEIEASTFAAARTSEIDKVLNDERYKGKITDKNRAVFKTMAENMLPAEATFGEGKDPLKPLRDMLETMPKVLIEGDVATFGASKDSGKPDDKTQAVYREISGVFDK